MESISSSRVVSFGIEGDFRRRFLFVGGAGEGSLHELFCAVLKTVLCLAALAGAGVGMAVSGRTDAALLEWRELDLLLERGGRELSL